MSSDISNVRPKPDKVLVDIVDYVTKYKIKSKDAYETARHCLMAPMRVNVLMRGCCPRWTRQTRLPGWAARC